MAAQDGKVTTFYSYKGGSGRSMALANVAWALATNGDDVLCLDWDFEAPGLHRYFHPFLADPEQRSHAGLIDRIWEYVDGDVHASTPGGFDELVQELELPLRGRGRLHFIGAGRQDGDYSQKVGGLDWTTFYSRFRGGAFVEGLMDWARGRYSRVLIDSRTGVADTAGICTTQVPDSVVMCFVYNRQSIEGTASVARSVIDGRRRLARPELSLHFCPSRVEDRSNVETARRYAADRLRGVLPETGHARRQSTGMPGLSYLRRNEVRHYPWCAFEEKLAVFEDAPDERGSLLDIMHDLAGRLAEREVRPQPIDQSILQVFWRRAAFDDPRMLELQTSAEEPLTAALPRLMDWVADAQSNPHERTEWLMTLAEACVDRGSDADILEPEFGGSLVDSGLRLGERAYGADPESYRVRFARLLESRAGQLQRQGMLEAARITARDAARLYAQADDPVSRWRQGRSLERIAELTYAIEGLEAALPEYRRLVALYRTINRRNFPVGAEIAPLRADRLLAERLIEAGLLDEAMHSAGRAANGLLKLPPSAREREGGEAVAIFATWAEARVAAGEPEEEVSRRVRGRAHAVLRSPGERRTLDQRLLNLRAERLLASGDTAAVLQLVEDQAGTPASGAGLIELRADALHRSGRAADALLVLADALARGEVRMTEAIGDLLVRIARDKPVLPDPDADDGRHPGLPVAAILPLIVRTLERNGQPPSDIGLQVSRAMQAYFAALPAGDAKG